MKSTATDSTSQKVSKILLEIGAVIFARNRPFKFDSGILSPVYVDNRLLISYPKYRKVVIKLLVEKIKNEGIKPDVIAGVATAGIPHAAWIAEELNLPMVFVRSKPKSHGRGNQIEGVVKKNQQVLVIEDLISTGGSSVRVIEALRRQGAKVSDLIAIDSHAMGESQKNFKKAKVKVHVLVDTPTIAEFAKKKGLLKTDQVKTILNWVKDPEGWGKKNG